ncbi:MAG: MoaD/ThiS family protein [Flavobacteriales bacterium]|nr:MoaD/ThiS family protein [Flavobacteriales bacterium]
MKIKLQFYGQAEEFVGQSEIEFQVPDTYRLKDATNKVLAQYPLLNSIQLTLAVNSQIEKFDLDLKPGDTIAFMPPFAGG